MDPKFIIFTEIGTFTHGEPCTHVKHAPEGSVMSYTYDEKGRYLIVNFDSGGKIHISLSRVAYIVI
jgi:YD repeat-containing protein